jgi:16S rRNA (adenine1518-N6/adenine1519-N6)-dimethyltransferase
MDPGDTVVEIGPGQGALTQQLIARNPARLILIEIDRALVAELRERYASNTKVEIVEGDVLEVDLASLVQERYLLAGNVPYYITTPILFKALEPPRPARAVFLVQAEVGQRMVAEPGSKIYGALSVNLQSAAGVETIMDVPPSAFRPAPSVDSAVVRVTPHAVPLVTESEAHDFRVFVQKVFALRRKQLRRVLRSVASVSSDVADVIARAADAAPDARPETLSPPQFVSLYRATRTPR